MGVDFHDNDIRYVPESGLDWCGLGHETRYHWVTQRFELAGKTVLDFGCGSGYGSHALAAKAKAVTGVDYSAYAIQHAKQKYASDTVSFVRADACSPDVAALLDTRAFDLIVSFDVLEHLERYFDYLHTICALIKKDGTVIIGCPNRLQTFNWNRAWNPYHFQEFSPYQLRRLLGLYFDTVTLVSQDFKDRALRDRVRMSIMGRETMPSSWFTALRDGAARAIPAPIKNMIRRARGRFYPGSAAPRYSYDDIVFAEEPGEGALHEAPTIIAICRGSKAG